MSSISGLLTDIDIVRMRKMLVTGMRACEVHVTKLIRGHCKFIAQYIPRGDMFSVIICNDNECHDYEHAGCITLVCC